jgi:putative glutamine amidotransferase
MSNPIIGITADYEDKGGYSMFPWYALRENYCEAVTLAGGIPIILPNEMSLVEHYSNLIDGLIVSGGAFDVDPRLFGEENTDPSPIYKGKRTQFELELTHRFLEDNKPIFGICGGEQLLGVALGGTLIQHIPDEITAPLIHEQENARNEAGHTVKIIENTKLHSIVGTTSLSVNSAHHQAVKNIPRGILVNAQASDGVIEGIEDPSKFWCIGVQWHPEFLISSGDKLLYQSFIRASTNG